MLLNRRCQETELDAMLKGSNVPYSLDLTGMPVYFSNTLWGARVLESARVFESARLIFKSLSGRTLPTDLSPRRVPVKSRVSVYSRVRVYFSIPVRGALQIEKIRYISMDLPRGVARMKLSSGDGTDAAALGIFT